MEKSFSDWLSTNFPAITVKLEYKLSRTDIVKSYFADFYFPDLNLIIELDGSQHKKTVEYDAERDAYISTNYGVEIIRISHAEYKAKTKIPLIMERLSIYNQ